VNILATRSDGVTAFGSSNSAFTITSPNSPNQAPSITGFTAPTSMNVGEPRTWSLVVNDPTNGSLTYNITWGDEYLGGPRPAFVQTTSFTHSYAQAGTYTVTMKVTNSAGLSAQTSATVTVTNSTVVASNITVTNPSNSTWVRGERRTITWTSTNLGSDSQVYISLVREGTSDYFDISSVYNRALNTGSYAWEVGKNAEGASMDKDGSYWVRVCNITRSVCNTTGGKILMTSINPIAPTPTPNPSPSTSPAPKTGAASDNAALSASIWEAIRQYYASQGTSQ
jgi:hypothetical protein